jgi:hypothetical protein
VTQDVEGNLDRRAMFWILHSFLRLLCHAVSVTGVMYSDNKIELKKMVDVE